MKSYRMHKLIGIMFAVLVLFGPVQNASASRRAKQSIHPFNYGSKNEFFRKANKHDNRHTRKKGYVGPFEHSHNYEYYGFTYSKPFGASRILVNGVSLYYHDGVFYKKCDKRGYDIVPAPIGAAVRLLPFGYTTHYKHGQKYYHHKGIYYRNAPLGYVIVRKPEFRVAFGNDDYYFHYSVSKW